jgi:hypothetical protein
MLRMRTWMLLGRMHLQKGECWAVAVLSCCVTCTACGC